MTVLLHGRFFQTSKVTTTNEARSRGNDAVAMEAVVEKAVDTAMESVVVMEAMVEDVSVDTMVVVGGGGYLSGGDGGGYDGAGYGGGSGGYHSESDGGYGGDGGRRECGYNSGGWWQRFLLSTHLSSTHLLSIHL